MDVLDGRARDLRAPHSFAGFLACPLLLLLLLLQVPFARARNRRQHQSTNPPVPGPLICHPFRRSFTGFAAHSQRIIWRRTKLPRCSPAFHPPGLWKRRSACTKSRATHCVSCWKNARKDPAQRAQRVGQAQEWIGGIAAEVDGLRRGRRAKPLDARAKLDADSRGPGIRHRIPTDRVGPIQAEGYGLDLAVTLRVGGAHRPSTGVGSVSILAYLAGRRSCRGSAAVSDVDTARSFRRVRSPRCANHQADLARVGPCGSARSRQRRLSRRRALAILGGYRLP